MFHDVQLYHDGSLSILLLQKVTHLKPAFALFEASLVTLLLKSLCTLAAYKQAT